MKKMFLLFSMLLFAFSFLNMQTTKAIDNDVGLTYNVVSDHFTVTADINDQHIYIERQSPAVVTISENVGSVNKFLINTENYFDITEFICTNQTYETNAMLASQINKFIIETRTSLPPNENEQMTERYSPGTIYRLDIGELS